MYKILHHETKTIFFDEEIVIFYGAQRQTIRGAFSFPECRIQVKGKKWNPTFVFSHKTELSVKFKMRDDHRNMLVDCGDIPKDKQVFLLIYEAGNTDPGVNFLIDYWKLRREEC